MKKTLLASSLAVGLGIVAGNTGHEAHASEADLNKASLAQMAQSNDQTLNQNQLKLGLIIIHLTMKGLLITLNQMVHTLLGITMQQVLMEQT